MGIFENMPPCTWHVGSETITLPVIRIETDGGNRIVEHARGGQEFEKLDDTGSIGDNIVLSVDWFNGNTEPGVDGDTQYPDLCNRMILSFRIHECGTLRLPTVGVIRCRARTWKRVEASDERDVAVTQFVFKRDNEDGVTAASFTSPSARSVARSVAEAATFSAQQAGVDLSDFGSSLQELAAGLEDLASAPAEQIAALEVQAKKIDAACKSFEALHTSVFGPGEGLLSFAPSAAAIRQMRRLQDMAARVVGERLSTMPTRRPVFFAEQRSLFQIAAQFNVPLETLLQANPQLAGGFSIPPNTPINLVQ